MNNDNITESTNCKNHPTVAAEWQCKSCQSYLCDQCIKVLNLPSESIRICPFCKGVCRNLEPEEQETKPFFELLPGAFFYPFEGNGKILLIAGAIFFWLLELIVSISLFGFFIMLFISGYLIAYMFRIIGSSANGDKELPDWPDFSDFWSDIVHPLSLVSATVVVCSLPVNFYFFLFPRSGQSIFLTDPLFWIAIIAGLLYFPMGLLAVALFNRVLALNPLLVIVSILKVPKEYLVACVILLFVYGASLLSKAISGYIPFFGQLLGWFLSLYFLMIEMRILGLIYYVNKKRLRWI